MSDSELRAAKTLAKGSALSTASTVFQRGLAFLSRLIIARFFGPASFGAYALYTSIVGLGGNLSLLGLPIAIQKEIAESTARGEDPRRIAGSGFAAVLLLTAVTFAVFLVFEPWVVSVFGLSDYSAYYLFFLAVVPFYAVSYYLANVALARRDLTPRVLIQFGVRPVLFLIGVYLGAIVFHSFLSVPLSYTISFAFSALAILVYDLSRGYLALHFDLRLALRLWRYALTAFALGIFAYLLAWTDKLLLGYFQGTHEVGIYAAANTVAQLVPLFLSTISALFLPVYSELRVSDPETARRVYARVTKWAVLLTAPFVILVAAHPVAVLNVLFGGEYAVSAPVLQILLLAFLFKVIFGPSGFVLYTENWKRFLLKISAAAAATNVLADLFLIPRFGAAGAAVGTLAAMAILSLSQLYALKKIGATPFSRGYILSILLAVAMLPLVVLLPHGGVLLLFLDAGVYFAAYLAACYLLRVFDNVDLSLLRSALSRLRR